MLAYAFGRGLTVGAGCVCVIMWEDVEMCMCDGRVIWYVCMGMSNVRLQAYLCTGMYARLGYMSRVGPVPMLFYVIIVVIYVILVSLPHRTAHSHPSLRTCREQDWAGG